MGSQNSTLEVTSDNFYCIIQEKP